MGTRMVSTFTDRLYERLSDASVAGSGYLAAWAINPDGSLSNDYVKSYPSNGGSVPFALEHIPNSSAYIAVDPSIGFVTFDFKNSSSLAATSAVTTPIPNQILNCWVSYSPKSGNFYITDPALSLVNEVHYDANLNPTLVKVCLTGFLPNNQ